MVSHAPGLFYVTKEPAAGTFTGTSH